MLIFYPRGAAPHPAGLPPWTQCRGLALYALGKKDPFSHFGGLANFVMNFMKCTQKPIHRPRRRRAYVNIRSSKCCRTAFDVPPSGSRVKPRRQTSSRLPSKCSTKNVIAKTASPNLVDSSQPAKRICLALANFQATMASLVTWSVLPCPPHQPERLLAWCRDFDPRHDQSQNTFDVV